MGPMSTRVVRFPEQGLPGTVVYYTEPSAPEADGEGGPVEVAPRGAVEVPAEAQLVYAADADGHGLAELAQLPPDTFVVVDLGGATDETLRSVGKLSGVRTLVVAGDFTDEGVRALGGLSSLGDLVLDSPRFTGAGLAALAGSETLASLDSLVLCGGGAFEPASLRQLAGRHNLGTLTIENTPVDDALADAVLTLAPPLTDLSVAERPGHELDLAVLERLLSTGLAVNGISAPPQNAAVFARAAADAAVLDEDMDEELEAVAEERGGVLRDIVREADLDELLAGPVPVLVDLTAPWCGPCGLLTPVLEDIVDACGDALTGVKIDVDEAEWAQERFDALSVPTVVLMRDGSEVFRFSGAWPPRRITEWLAAAGIHVPA